MTLAISPEVASALADGGAVVALESTIFSPFGLPAPANREALDRCLAAVRAGGAVPAMTAVLDGVARVGLAPDQHDRILAGGVKVAERDLPVAISQGLPVGVTTVSASLALSATSGVAVFATGGIGGVHRDAEVTGDVSADLGAIAAYPVVTVSAGAKAFLDLARTLEQLETLGVPVLGWRTDDFPMFWCRSSGLPVPHRIDDAAAAVGVARAQRALGVPRGVLVAVPIPEDAAIPREQVEAAIDRAVTDAGTGAAATPRVLAAIADATDGRTVRANIVLAEHNASVAAAVAREFTQV
jgi:pseudouridine-5'-phosphate glycosidase